MSKAPLNPNSSHSCSPLSERPMLVDVPPALTLIDRYSPSEKLTNGPHLKVGDTMKSPPNWRFANSKPLSVTSALRPGMLTPTSSQSYPTPRPNQGSKG